MYTMFRILKWITQSKRAELNNNLVAHITQWMLAAGEEKDKAVGTALLKAEQEKEKRKHLWNLLKYYATHSNDGSWAEREIPGEDAEGVPEAK